VTDSLAAGPTTGLEIAIIGMVGRFPGAKTLDAFWQNLRDGVESVTFFADDELTAAGVNAAALDDPHYVKAGAILDDIELFDAPFFGFNPREAEVIDPQQRIFLECAWEALEHAGYNAELYEGAIGVYAGVSMSTYFFNLYADYDPLVLASSPQILLGNGKDYLATRVSYKMNLDGPSVSVQTACSTALVAVHMAARSLLSGECDLALAGAVSINVPQKLGYRYQEESIFSPDGHCRAFDAQAQGTVFGNGVGIVVLKRLADALDDGDTIYAVIKGTAINNDGALKVGYTAPSVEGQAKAITAAQRVAEVEPDTITYVETHGTGTLLGDPIEVAALTQAFRAGTDRTGFCALGSVKTNIGHTNVAAGIAGLIKAVLALQHEQIPPSLHFHAPNPNIDFASSPFYVNSMLAEWPTSDVPRRAGVSSFGLGGTNAHAVIEEAPPLAESGAARPWQLLLLSARTSSALETATANLAAHLRSHPEHNLADIAYTLQVGRKSFEHRRMLVCRDHADALAALAAGASRVFTSTQEPTDRPVVFMFPGGGTQYVNMGRELYETEPVFREQIDTCAELLRPRIGYDLREIIYPTSGTGTMYRAPTTDGGAASSDQRPALTRTSVALPALFMVEYALAQLWLSWGVQPAALIGHSLGEYVAACLSGVFTLDDALALVLLRGQLIEQLPSGAMLSVSLAEADLGPLMNEQLSLAAINGPSLCVASGPLAAIEALAATLRTQSISFRRIKIEAAGHSELITPILEPFTQFVRKLHLRAPGIPYISNVTGTWISASDATDPQYWARHLRQTVRFAAGVAELLQEPTRILLEVGPGQALTALARQQPCQGAQPTVLASTRHRHETRSDVAVVLETLGQLWLAGVRVDWTAFSDDQQRRRLPLPTYPFERQRYWIEPQRQSSMQRGLSQRKADIADWFYIPSWKLSLPPAPMQADMLGEIGARWLLCIDDDVGPALVKWLEHARQAVIVVRAGTRFDRLADGVYMLDPGSADDYIALLQELRSLDKLPDIVVHLWTLTPLSAQSGRAFFKQAQDRGYYSLLFLCHALEAEQISAPLRIEVVSNQLHSITEAEIAYPEKATLLGPCKVIPQEYPNITCHCIDIGAPAASDAQARLIERLLAEIAANTPDRVIAYRGSQRWVQTFEPVRLDDGAKPSRAIRDQGVYLITGGLGNVGLLLAKQLAQSAARLTLIGRAGLPPRDEWASWLATHEPREDLSHKIRSVLELEELGAEVLVIGADVADADQMRAALAQTSARFGALHGVIHAAGITSGDSIFQPISAIRRDESEAQFRPKAYGLYVLAELLRDQALDFCMLISSNATILGGLGLIAYSAANLFMDAFAAQQSKLGAVSWISTNWDGWPARADDRLQTAVSTSLDQYAMTPKVAVDAFSRIVTRATVAQIAVSAGDLPARIDFWTRQLAATHAAEQHPDAPDMHPRPELQSSYVAPRNAIEHTLADIWQSLLGIDEVGVEDNFFRLGGHSLLATQLTSRVRDTFQIALPVRSLFEAPTVAAFAKRIAQALAEQLDPAMLTELEQLSREEAQAILALGEPSNEL
jgi:acyl transferase domain-containing protein